MVSENIQKIWLYDNVIIGNNHISINSGLINIAQYLCDTTQNNHAQIRFHGDTSHWEIIKNECEAVQSVFIDFKPIKVIHPAAGIIAKAISWFNKIKSDRKEFVHFLKNAQQEKPDLIILNTITPINFSFFLKKIKEYPTLNFLWILHGELEYFFSDKIDKKTKIYKQKYSHLFDNIPTNLKLVALNNYIKENLIEKKLLSSSQIFSIQHPLAQIKNTSLQKSEKAPLNLLHIGVANLRKNSNEINVLAQLLKNDTSSIQILGRTEIELDEGIILLSKDNRAIPQHVFEETIANADYALSFISEPEYVYRVSGSLLDAIIYAVPILALKHPAVNELFKLGGNIGYLFNNVEEMSEMIMDISKNRNQYIEEYHLQKKNLIALKKLFSPEAIAKDLKYYICTNT